MKDVQLFKGDCIEVMKSLDKRSVNLVLTDPPFGTTACSWDTVIPMFKMWGGVSRMLYKDSTVVLFGSEPFSSRLRLSNLIDYKYDWIWKKNTISNPLMAKKQPLRCHENIMVFTNGKHFYFPQDLKKIDKIQKQGSKRTELTSGGKPVQRRIYHQEHTNYPKNILEFNSASKTVHPTQKPVPLLEYLIKTYTLEGETVLDFTMGSGSTGVACVNTNRKFIGIEMDDKYFEIARQRIQDAIDAR